jgi:nucleoside-diphosphate-sugar epimerase
MTALKVLFIGGTGVISSACSRRAVAAGIDLTILNRDATRRRPAPDGADVIRADVRDPAPMRAAIGDRTFDVVADFVAFTLHHVQADIDVFGGRTGQYVFIGSASAYQTPPRRLPIVESTPLRNPYWAYSRDKIACEDLLVAAYREGGFPATIVRPSHTYDRTVVPLMGGWTDVERMRRGRPVVHGDGTSLWVLTHHDDFAHAFVGLLGHPQAIGCGRSTALAASRPGPPTRSPAGRPPQAGPPATTRRVRSRRPPEWHSRAGGRPSRRPPR